MIRVCPLFIQGKPNANQNQYHFIIFSQTILKDINFITSNADIWFRTIKVTSQIDQSLWVQMLDNYIVKQYEL